MKMIENAELLIAGLALLVSVVSIWLSIKEAKQNRKHNILSVKPLPRFSGENINGRFKLFIGNNGLGPAIINEIFVHYNGRKIKSIEFFELYFSQLAKKPNEIYLLNFRNNLTILSGEKRLLVEFEYNEKDDDKIREFWMNLNGEIIYKDIYNIRHVDLIDG